MSTPRKSRYALDGEIITIRRGLAIYKVKASPYWWCRIRDTRHKKNIVRSTKETSRIKAREVAEELYVSLFSEGAIAPTPKNFTFTHFADLLLIETEQEIKKGSRSKSLLKDLRYILNNDERGLIKAFGSRDVRELTTADYTTYIRKVISNRDDLSASTHNQIRTCFRKVLKVALLDGVITAIPEIPKMNRSQPGTRTFFRFYPLVPKDRDDYQRLLEKSTETIQHQTMVRGIPVTDELRDIIIFTVHSFIRPTYSELYALKHSDITIRDNPKRLLLTVRKGKTGHRIIDTMPAAVTVYQRILKRHKEYSQKDDYLFLPQYKNRETAKRIIMRQFNYVLEIAGLKQDQYTGLPHSMYSLRHTCCCMRIVLSEGQVNLYALAKNAGTSVDMLERFYLRNLPNSSELARNLQSFGKAV
jgi:hypothetical protein